MKIVDESKILLESSGYRTKFSEEDTESLYFEDDSLLGIVIAFPDSGELLSVWKERHNDFLTRNASKIRMGKHKAWNIYTIFLTSEETDEKVTNVLLDIEENLQGTRKIARCNIKTREDLMHALYPIIPIQNKVVLQSENFVERVRERVTLGERTLEAFLRSTDIEEVANLIMDEE